MDFKDAVNGGRIVELLEGTGRFGMKELIEWLYGSDFFEAPASTRFHGCCEGGLAVHSLNVFERLHDLVAELKVEVPAESVVIAALLHDVCKVGLYIETPDGKNPYKVNKENPKGHAVLSIERIQKFIELTEVEELMIRFHMGVYGLVEFEEKRGEYSLRGGGMAHAWFHHPVVKLMYFADELATISEAT